MEQLRVQSVLFQSPYSGCPSFSGWPKDPCQKPALQGGHLQVARNVQGPLLCVDRYRPGSKTRNGYWWDLRGNPSPPRAQIRCIGPVQGGKFTIAGPSTTGPWTVRVPGFTPAFGISNATAGRLG